MSNDDTNTTRHDGGGPNGPEPRGEPDSTSTTTDVDLRRVVTESRAREEQLRALLAESENARRVAVNRFRRARRRVRLAEWRLRKATARRSWRLVTTTAEAARQPRRLVALPADVVRIITSPSFDEPAPSGPHRPQTHSDATPSDAPKPRPAPTPTPTPSAQPPTRIRTTNDLNPLPNSHLAELRSNGLGDLPMFAFDRLPSFRAKLRQSQRQGAIVRQYGGALRVWQHNSKQTGYAVAIDAGLQIPKQYSGPTTFARLDRSRLPDRFVIKPTNGTFSRGILLLERDGDAFFDHVDGEHKTLDAVAETLEQLAATRTISRTFTVEELLEPHPTVAGDIGLPDDFKIYCFADRPVVIMQRRLHGSSDPTRWTFKFWSADWHDLGPATNLDRLDPSLPRPHLGEELLEASSRIAGHINVPFCRYDLYETARGVVFGEVSPHPGGEQNWAPELDALLGLEWELSEAKLLVEGFSHIAEPGG